MNGYRSNYAYGRSAWATTTSWNGSKLGTSVSPGFSGTVFEPIDPFKGDLVRSQFYMATRYFGEDGELVRQRLVRRRRDAAVGGRAVPASGPANGSR